jgi:NADPH:quinone reductase-like Zn-dependent oxidoreductase
MRTVNDMRAARFDRYGPPEVLYETRVPVPVAGPDQVLVRVHGTGVSLGEMAGRSGKFPLLTGRSFPRPVGIEFAGEVVALAAGRSDFALGDGVWGLLPFGQYLRGKVGSAAEYVAVQPRRLASTPKGLDLVRAAALPASGTTAITALRDRAALKAGERLLVRGGSGGVGSLMVQWGHSMGAHVTALAGAKNLDFVRDLGADEVFDYASTTPADLGTFDVIADTVGTDIRAYRGLLTSSGRMVTIAPDANHLLASTSYIIASMVYGSKRVRFFSGNPTHKLLADLTAYVESGAMRPVVDTVHPLADIAAAHRALEAGGVRGKHVVQVI